MLATAAPTAVRHLGARPHPSPERVAAMIDAGSEASMGLSQSPSDEAFNATGGGHKTLSGHGGFTHMGLLAAQQAGLQVRCAGPTVWST